MEKDICFFMEDIQYTFTWWDFPNYNYMFRIDTIKIILLMQHIQENLQLKAGRLRNVTIAGNKLKNLPVYERGGKVLKSWWEFSKVQLYVTH